MQYNRSVGILLHPTSLPSPYGIGDMGHEAYNFVNFMKAAGQTLWQTLPLGPTSYGNSPYSALSAFAGNPLLISPDKLIEAGLLEHNDFEIPHFENKNQVNFDNVANFKYELLEKAFSNFNKSAADVKKRYNKFCMENAEWLDDFAIFMAAKKYHNEQVWSKWSEELIERENLSEWKEKLADRIAFHKFVQYVFSEQWQALKSYANSQNIKIVGDIPIFVAYDSADVWANKKYFTIDEKGHQLTVAGVPPDYFSATGQLWGNPLYKWDVLEAEDFSWWKQRVAHLLKMVDIIRIDHFRGFEAYWEIPAGAPNAIKGQWVKAPGKKLFQSIIDEFGDLPIIAEDLGVITPEVEDLRDSFGLPGMKVLQFSFGYGGDKNFLPFNHIRNSVVYTGTHDNDTTHGFFESEKEKGSDVLHHAQRYLNYFGENLTFELIRCAYSSVAHTVIIPMQDILNLGTEHRMNFPGKADGNWGWRYNWYQVSHDLAHRLHELSEIYERLPEQQKKH